MDLKTVGTRIVDGHEVPAPGVWMIDPAHSDIEFVVRHMMISKVRGRFRQFDGTIVIGERPDESRVEAFIDAASIDTGDETRDQHLRSADFLDVEHHPTVRFTSTSIRPDGDEQWKVTGELTICDVTNTVVLDVEHTGAMIDPWGNLRCGFAASTKIDREDFGITWNQALEAGGFLVGKELAVDIDVEAVLQTDS